MANKNAKTAKAAAGKTSKKVATKERIKRTPEELAEMRAKKLADMEAKEAARQEKLAARKAKLEHLLNASTEKAEKKAAKLAERTAKKEARELKRLEKAEFRATRLLEIEAERQRKLAEKAASGGTVTKRGAGFKSGPDGKDSIGEFITKTVKDTPMTVEALQDALVTYYGGGERSEQWKRTVATYFHGLRSAYPMKLKLAKRGMFTVYDDNAKTIMVRAIKPKEQAEIFGGMMTYKLAKQEARAKKIADAQATIARIAEIRAKEAASAPENQ